MTFGGKLRHVRLLRGLTQAELAEKIDTSNVTISLYERGLRDPSFANLRRLAISLNVTADYLLGIEKETQL